LGAVPVAGAACAVRVPARWGGYRARCLVGGGRDAHVDALDRLCHAGHDEGDQQPMAVQPAKKFSKAIAAEFDFLRVAAIAHGSM